MLDFEGTRLDDLQKQALDHALSDIHAPVYLFGSRAVPTKKGCDVDIQVISDELFCDHFKKSLKIIHSFQAICEEKIDVVIFPDYAHQSPVQKDFFDHVTKKQLK